MNVTYRSPMSGELVRVNGTEVEGRYPHLYLWLDTAQGVLRIPREALEKDGSSTMQDITGAEYLEVEMRQDGKVLWVSIDGITVLRVCQIKNLILTDNRKAKGLDASRSAKD